MNSVKIITILFWGLVFTVISYGAYAADTTTCDANYKVGQSWLATGTVTKIDGSTFYFLGKDNNIYQIDGKGSEVFVDDTKASPDAWSVGDMVRVYGTVTEPCKICADKVRVFKRDDACNTTGVNQPPAGSSEKEVRIIIEQGQIQPAGQGAGTARCEVPANLSTWRGWIADINYGTRRISLQTSAGAFDVSLGDALITQGGAKVGLGILNLGDAVMVTGVLTCAGQVSAQQIEVTRTRTDAQGALPQTPASIIGVIQQIDYKSMTFKMQTESTTVVVMVDKNTCFQHYHDKASFADLKPGVRVKMNGNGSLSTGYAAQFIMIIGVAP